MCIVLNIQKNYVVDMCRKYKPHVSKNRPKHLILNVSCCSDMRSGWREDHINCKLGRKTGFLDNRHCVIMSLKSKCIIYESFRKLFVSTSDTTSKSEKL